jgi:hypothetical protein
MEIDVAAADAGIPTAAHDPDRSPTPQANTVVMTCTPTKRHS